MANLLVVDDEPDIALMIERLFTKLGHAVVTASDGAEALARIAAAPPDLILLDLHLPRMNGWEVCRRLKRDPATARIPILMMTAAHANVDAAQAGIDLGAVEYVAKPFMREVLVHNVERLLARDRQ
jgi:CheY-like chemotaxis protein